MDGQGIPPLTEINSRYEGIYPQETIELIYLFLRGRIDSLTPIVKANKGTPLMTAAQREACEKGEDTREMERKSQNNEATKQALDDCEVAWERLINGTAHLCTVCGEEISKDRKQAVPSASRCKGCQEKKGLRVS